MNHISNQLEITSDSLRLKPPLGPDFAGSVSAFALVMDTLDLLQVCRILPGSVRRQIRVPGEGRMPVAARWGGRQHTAGRLDPKLPLMLFNEGNHLPNRRSSSACAKYTDAFLWIPLAWRSCLFPRSNAFSRACRSLVKPSRRRAHRRLGPLERTGRVVCQVSNQASTQSPCGLRCHCHLQAAVGEKAEFRARGTPPCISGGFFLSTGLIL